MKTTPLLAAAFLVSVLMAPSSHAVSLSPTPALDPAGSELLNAVFLGMPLEGDFLLWPIYLLEWNQTGQVAIEIDVLYQGAETTTPKQYAVFLSAQNSTPDVWAGFELALSGPATFSLIAPTDLTSPTTLPAQKTLTEITYTGLAWDQASFGARNFSFAMDVTAPIADEPVRLTLTPLAAIPEPGSFALCSLGFFTVLSRRTRR